MVLVVDELDDGVVLDVDDVGGGIGMGLLRGAMSSPYTQTGVFFFKYGSVQSMSMAGMLTRTQPCEAGYAGTEPSPCTARPPSKYFGR